MDTPPESADEWAKLIRGLTPDYPDDEPWQLVVDDITKPAFMQPPARSADKLAEYLYKNVKGKHEAKNGEKEHIVTPDQLDMLVTSKNHDLKSSVAVQSGFDDWMFALITLQTNSGQNGVGNYPISRIRSAYSGRPAFSLAPTYGEGVIDLGRHVKQDIFAILKGRPKLLDKYSALEYQDIDGLSLLWMKPWDGESHESLPTNILDPLYLEVCRRIRLHINGNGLEGIRANSKKSRINEKTRGRTGDPWTPEDSEGLALNVGPVGFTYRRIVNYLVEWQMPPLLSLTPSRMNTNMPTALVSRSLRCNTRKQGLTEGYDERVIPLRLKTMQAFGRDSGTKELGELAKERIEQIGIVQDILRHAIATFATWSDSDRTNTVLRSRAQDNPLRKKIDEWVSKLDEIIDDSFFEDLQTEFEAVTADRESIRNQWLMNGKDGVVDHANHILLDAENALPCPSIQRYKARVQADSVFWGRLHGRNGLPDLYPLRNNEDVEDKE